MGEFIVDCRPTHTDTFCARFHTYIFAHKFKRVDMKNEIRVENAKVTRLKERKKHSIPRTNSETN